MTLKELRISKKLTQEQVANLVGISFQNKKKLSSFILYFKKQ